MSQEQTSRIHWNPGRVLSRVKLMHDYHQHAKDIDRLGLRLARAYDISSYYEYHACFDGVLLCDYPEGYSIRSLTNEMRVVDYIECPKCLDIVKHMKDQAGPQWKASPEKEEEK
jgi:hypothetical protein